MVWCLVMGKETLNYYLVHRMPSAPLGSSTKRYVDTFVLCTNSWTALMKYPTDDAQFICSLQKMVK